MSLLEIVSVRSGEGRCLCWRLCHVRSGEGRSLLEIV